MRVCMYGRARARHCRGFTLVELMVAVTLACLLAGMAYPSFQSSASRARRIDAVAALTRVQIAQENFRANNGSYSQHLAGLRGAASPRSEAGAYDISLSNVSGEGYLATATARSDGPQAADDECARLTVNLSGGFSERGPTQRCWNP